MQEPPPNGTCRASRADGSRCRAKAFRGGLCLFHDDRPDAKERRIQVARAGGVASGRTRRNKAEQARTLEPVELKDAGDALGLIEVTINDLRRGAIDCARARLHIRASEVVLRHAEAREIAQRLKFLEDKVRAFHLDDADAWQGLFDSIREVRRRAARKV